MMEMSRAYVDFYVGGLQRLVAPDGLFYCVNRVAKNTSGESVRLADYPFDDRWHPADARPVPWQDNLIELALERTPDASADLRQALEAYRLP